MHKKDIKNFTLKELEEAIVTIQQPSYRARQIFFWLYQRGILDFNEMGNIPKRLRDEIGRKYYISNITPSEHLKSIDKTEKFLFELSDGNYIETVIIHAAKRKTICLSTQVGCKFACPFCASGRKGFTRNLTASEIINQAHYLQNNLKHKITNYVFMGMGEPLDNYENVTKAIMIMNKPKGMDIGARRITISTCGIVPAIEKLKDLGIQINLSISLHAANNGLRDKLVPINKRYPLERLIKACEEFIEKTGKMITFEYVLIKGMNASPEDADELAVIAKRLKAKVNLIPYSTVQNLNFQSPQEGDIDIFIKRLANSGVNVTLRQSKGEDIQAACGQLAGKKKSEI